MLEKRDLLIPENLLGNIDQNKYINDFINKELTTLDIIESMKPFLVNSDIILQNKALTSLSIIVISVAKYMNEYDCNVLLQYCIGKIFDEITHVCHLLTIIYYLLKQNCSKEAAPKFFAQFTHSNNSNWVQTLKQSDRHILYKICLLIFRNVPLISLTKIGGTTVLHVYLSIIGDEKDPRNLFIIFEINLFLLRTLSSLDGYVDEFYENLACYFPIDYKPDNLKPKISLKSTRMNLNVEEKTCDIADKNGFILSSKSEHLNTDETCITPAVLSQLLYKCLVCRPEFISFNLTLALEKANSLHTNSQKDSLLLFRDTFKSCCQSLSDNVDKNSNLFLSNFVSFMLDDEEREFWISFQDLLFDLSVKTFDDNSNYNNCMKLDGREPLILEIISALYTLHLQDWTTLINNELDNGDITKAKNNFETLFLKPFISTCLYNINGYPLYTNNTKTIEPSNLLDKEQTNSNRSTTNFMNDLSMDGEEETSLVSGMSRMSKLNSVANECHKFRTNLKLLQIITSTYSQPKNGDYACLIVGNIIQYFDVNLTQIIKHNTIPPLNVLDNLVELCFTISHLAHLIPTNDEKNRTILQDHSQWLDFVNNHMPLENVQSHFAHKEQNRVLEQILLITFYMYQSIFKLPNNELTAVNVLENIIDFVVFPANLQILSANLFSKRYWSCLENVLSTITLFPSEVHKEIINQKLYNHISSIQGLPDLQEITYGSVLLHSFLQAVIISSKTNIDETFINKVFNNCTLSRKMELVTTLFNIISRICGDNDIIKSFKISSLANFVLQLYMSITDKSNMVSSEKLIDSFHSVLENGIDKRVFGKSDISEYRQIFIHNVLEKMMDDVTNTQLSKELNLKYKAFNSLATYPRLRNMVFTETLDKTHIQNMIYRLNAEYWISIGKNMQNTDLIHTTYLWAIIINQNYTNDSSTQTIMEKYFKAFSHVSTCDCVITSNLVNTDNTTKDCEKNYGGDINLSHHNTINLNVIEEIYSNLGLFLRILSRINTSTFSITNLIELILKAIKCQNHGKYFIHYTLSSILKPNPFIEQTKCAESLFKQKLFSVLYPKLISMYENNRDYQYSVCLVISQFVKCLPLNLAEMHVEKLIPLSLDCLNTNQENKTDSDYDKYTQDVYELILDMLKKYPSYFSNSQIRTLVEQITTNIPANKSMGELAIDCQILTQLAQVYHNTDILCHKSVITKWLKPLLGHSKRMVRKDAGHCINIWYCL